MDVDALNLSGKAETQMPTPSSKPKLPTMAGRQVLLNIAAGKGSAFGVRGMSAYGGLHSTMVALRRSGLVVGIEELTDSGREMVARLKSKQ